MKHFILLMLLFILSCEEIKNINNPTEDFHGPQVTIAYPFNTSIIDTLTNIIAVASDVGGDIFKTSFYIDGYHIYDDYDYPYEFEFDICAYNNNLNEYNYSMRSAYYPNYYIDIPPRIPIDEIEYTTSILALTTDSNGNVSQSNLIYVIVDDTVDYDCYEVCMGNILDSDKDGICDDVDDCIYQELIPTSCYGNNGEEITCPEEYSCNYYGDGTYFINYYSNSNHMAYLVDECSNIFELYDDYASPGYYQYYLNNQDFETGFYQFIVLEENEDPTYFIQNNDIESHYSIDSWSINYFENDFDYYYIMNNNQTKNIYICNLEGNPIIGCTEYMACNYNPNAIYSNLSCWYPDEGCTCMDGENATYKLSQNSECYNPIDGEIQYGLTEEDCDNSIPNTAIYSELENTCIYYDSDGVLDACSNGGISIQGDFTDCDNTIYEYWCDCAGGDGDGDGITDDDCGPGFDNTQETCSGIWHQYIITSNTSFGIDTPIENNLLYWNGYEIGCDNSSPNTLIYSPEIIEGCY